MSPSLRAWLAAAALPLALASPVYASGIDGCSGLNAFHYPVQSTSTPPMLLLPVNNLKIGDTIQISASGLPSTGLQVQDSLGNIVLQFGTLSSTVETQQFTVSTADETTLFA